MDDVFPSEIKNKWEDEPPNLHLIGNLPFNVSTPLIIKLLHAISERRGPWKHGRVNLTLTFQEEVGYRMSVPPGDKERCRLSVMCQHLCHVDTKFIIPGSAFVPAPKVNVAVVTFNPLKKPLISQPFKLVEKVARHTFHYKQKMVRKGIEIEAATEASKRGINDEAIKNGEGGRQVHLSVTSGFLGENNFKFFNFLYVHIEQK
ncbi:TFB1M [Mytilus edulis]|uniref:rRNA adenine N(6)-methyltransferase n=1 Tax=Mytilus edulis TaxID=6550 RepID=A0A8S3T508_MYTED|nr:TFB1M [Mytilus edulis]